MPLATIGLYFDEHMNRRVADALQQRGFRIVMAVDADMEGKDDFDHLAYATANGLVMVTFDHPFAGRLMSMIDLDHLGLVCLTQTIRQDIGQMVTVLSEFLELYDPEKAHSTVIWLP